MRKKFVIALCIFAGVFILYFVLRGDKVSITNYPSDGTTVVAFGDSLIQGVGSTRGNDVASLLSTRIGEPIINMGVSGNTSADGLARVDSVIARDPRIVILLFGGNDVLRRVPTEETFQNLSIIIDRLHEAGSIVVLVGVRGGVLSDPYARRYEELSTQKGTLYVPNVLSGVIGNSTLMSDAIHPNDLGYMQIADKIFEVLKRLQ